MHFPCVLLSCEESEQMQSLHKKDLSTKNEADDFYYRPKKTEHHLSCSRSRDRATDFH